VSETTPSCLVTGATGFLGRHVIDAIRRHDPDSRIIALVRSASAVSRSSLDYLNGVDLIEGSLIDWELWHLDTRLERLSGIYHLAGEVKHSRANVDQMMHVNVDGTTGMVRLAASKGCRIVFVSSSGTVGCSDDPDYSPDESAPWCEDVARGWPYYLSKIRAEQASLALSNEIDADLVIMRPPVMLGPGDHRLRSTAHVIRVLEGRLPLILKGGMNFCDIRDIADAIVRAMKHPSPQLVYNLPGTASSLEDFFLRVANHAGIKKSWRAVPSRLLLAGAKLNAFLGGPLSILPDPVVIEMGRHYWGLSSSHAESDLGYRSRNPDETLRDTIRWIRSSRPVSAVSA
jgi:nucleoside-diphosphate-sugar epimerase